MRRITLLLFIVCKISSGSVWHVGAMQAYTTVTQVQPLVQNGDTVLIDGGIFANDNIKWTKNNLKIIGLGTSSNRTIIQNSGNIANGKGIFVFDSPSSGNE